MPDGNRVRYEMLTRLGYFVTESSEHFAEYMPYFIRRDRPDLIERFNVPLDEYISRCEFMDKFWGDMKTFFEGDEPIADVERSHEYGALIIHSIETGTPRVVYGNVPNRGLITNLQAGLLRRGAVPGRTATASSRRASATCRRSSPASS